MEGSCMIGTQDVAVLSAAASTSSVVPGNEMAYLLLDECYDGFYIDSLNTVDCTTNEITTTTPIPFHQWINVNIIQRKENHGDYTSSCIEEDTSVDNNPVMNQEDVSSYDNICRRCHVILKSRTDCVSTSTATTDLYNESPSATNISQQPQLVLDLNYILPFDGTVHDIQSNTSNNADISFDFDNKNASKTSDQHHQGCCSCTSSRDDGISSLQYHQRSDAALLVGLLVACSKHVQIVQCNVMLIQHLSNSHDDEDNNTFYGAFLFTLAFPHLSLQNIHAATNTDMVRRQIIESTLSNTRSSKTTKLLYPALQLLLTLIRSDWDQMENIKFNLLHHHKNKNRLTNENTRRASYFPSTLSLGQMYNRIHSSNSILSRSNQQQQEQSNTEESSNSSNTSQLLALPLDIIQRHIALYFDAQSLAMIRSTCTYFHWSLRTIVPGLKLRLYTHQIDSLYWMRQRESSLVQLESSCFDPNLCHTDESGDIHRAITGGATVKLVRKPSSTCTATEDDVVYLDPITGIEISHDELNKVNDLHRNVARGGLLCDDPGLGKTITVLALILQTPQTLPHPKEPNLIASNDYKVNLFERTGNDKLFEAYWTEEVVPEFRRPALLKLINEFYKKIPAKINFPLIEIQRFIAIDGYGSSFRQFNQKMVETITECSTDESHDTSSLFVLWNTIVSDFKEFQMRSVRKSFANTNAKPNSRVAALVEAEARKKLTQSLVPSAGTLIVVPSVLLEHWKTQIYQHVDPNYCTDKIPLLFEYQRKDTIMTVDKVIILCRLNRTHSPLVFFDNGGTRPLPPAEFLAMFKIVITTTQRFMNEAKKGSFQEELDRSSGVNQSSLQNLEGYESCELLKIYWMRLVVDEGHSMGNDRNNSTIQFASWVKAHKRWAMTGTPTKHNSAQLGQMRGLMNFLQHEFFTSRLGGDAIWKMRIVKGWKDGDFASFYRLRNLLRFLMRRHTKLDIVELPPPIFLKNQIDTSYEEANTYNTLVSGVQMNLLLTSMKGKTSGFQDSLLHRSQTKSARLALQNIRRVCTGWSRVVPTLAFRFYAETVEMAKSFNHSEDAIAKIKLFMSRAEQEELTACSFCGIRISTMLVMSCCGGLICTECMDSAALSCYLCDESFDVDELQKFQPGFVLDWRSNLETRKPRNEAIEADESQESISEIAIRPMLNRQRTKKVGDGHTCEYDAFAVDGRCVHCLAEHSFCFLLNERLRCTTCHRLSEECPVEESKSYFLTQHLLELHRNYSQNEIRLCSSDWITKTRPLKVIVFSQFRAALNVVGDRLLRKFGTACVAEYFGSHRKMELHKFTNEDCCFCLLLTKDGSEGLDLSFVTNVIFLEELYDKSLQDQVVARAWRMGASGRVVIETLIAKNTIEEVIGEQMKTRYDESEMKSNSTTGDQQRLKSCLQSLRFITDHHSALTQTTTSNNDKTYKSEIKGGTLKRSLQQLSCDEYFTKESKRRVVRFE